jgi:two-component system LytT family sensor kinase
MKKYFLFIAGLIILHCNSRGIAQTIVPTEADIKRFMHNMSDDPADKWVYSGLSYYNESGIKAPNFDVWIKARSIYKIRYFFNFHLKENLLSGQLYNAAGLELATTSITPANAAQYQYRVVTNDSLELVPWTTPSVFKSNKFISYAYLGKFDCRRKTIILTIAKKNNKSNKLVCIYNSDDIPAVKITGMDVEYPTGRSAKDASDRKGFSVWSGRNPEAINLGIEGTLRNELYHVYLKRESNGQETILPVGNNWEHDVISPATSMHISSTYFDKPGKYTMIIRPEMKLGYENPVIVGAEVSVYFTVYPGPATIPLKTVEFVILVILSTGSFMFLMYRRKQKQKLAHEARNKQIAMLQLQGVRAQLNPHFIFNALAGVQNLMNKNEVENANRYLVRFARLTRNILDEGQKELTTIDHEIAMLTDYLEMEQMRFGFKFSNNIEPDIDQQIEIPAMLLQPFIENAVKHGVSNFKNAGLITVSIIKKSDDIVLAVQDNGKGFSGKQPVGMGIKLCEDRIKLLNSIYKNTFILLHIHSDSKGTLITIELQKWL